MHQRHRQSGQTGQDRQQTVAPKLRTNRDMLGLCVRSVADTRIRASVNGPLLTHADKQRVERP